MQDILNPGDIPVMPEERRYAQQETLEHLVDTTTGIDKKLGDFIVSMTDRMAKVETTVDQMRSILANQAIVIGKHSEAISWIKGAGASAIAIFSVFIVWILNHIAFK